ncbi:MAG: hypothetical protein D6731_22825 [Planctomycetota bacterium]|nr:MAG: hypothetical protein D6731_22825 [Planctomycetota bacterium]
MKKAPPPRGHLLRACGGLLAALSLLVFLLWTFLVDPLDETPLLGSAAARETEQLLADEAARLARAPVERGRLQAGWAARDITPPLGAPTYGYGARRGRGVERVADPVSVRAIALRAGSGPPVVLLSADLCLWVSDVSAAIARAVADFLPRRRLYFAATHDHSAPGGYADGPAAAIAMGARRPALVSALVKQSAAAVRAALADLAPAALRHASAPAPQFVRNRTRRGVPLDDELTLLELRKNTGERAALVTYSAHATVVGSGLLVCSADYPGALRRRLEAKGYALAVFCAGSTGQAGPVPPAEARGADDLLRARRLGEALADRVLALARGNQAPFEEEPLLASFRAPLRVAGYRWPQLGGMLNPKLTAWLVGYPTPPVWIHALRVGEAVYVGHSFEFSSVLARRLGDRARGRGQRLVLTSFNGDHNLYVVPPALWGEGYEAGMTLYGPGLGPYLERITQQVADFLASGPPFAPPNFDLSR